MADADQLWTDIGILLDNIRLLEQATGETIDGEDGAIVDEIERAYKGRPPSLPWQDMAAAPKDRDIIVGYGHGVVAGAFWHEPRHAWFEFGMDPEVAEPCEPHGWIPMPPDETLVIKLPDGRMPIIACPSRPSHTGGAGQ